VQRQIVEDRSEMSRPNVTNGTAPNAEGEQLFAVRLIDRRTGEVPNFNGNPLSVLTRSPRAAIADLMSGRNQKLWRAEVEPVGSPALHQGRGVAF